jgi:hypothetical protein
VTAAAASLALPPCPGCAGGREVNGVPCRDCGGTGRQRARQRQREFLRALGRSRPALAAAGAAGTLVRWSASVPGVAGAAGVTIGLAMITHGLVPRIPELGAALAVGGVFGLLADRQL